jgi:NodT family efflux transporter outer membrane factor (OMF) lipoprotein
MAMAAAAAAGTIAGCGVGPTYEKPQVEMPAAWKVDEPFRVATPADADDKGQWWLRFGDPTLNDLEQKALAANPTLALAAARLAQAQASADSAMAALYPSLGVGARVQRLKISGNRPLTNYASPLFSTVQNDYTLAFTTSYEADFFGRVHSSIQGAQASAQQSEADFANTQLLLTTELAGSYVSLRSVDTEIDVVRRSVALQRRALDLITSRYDLGAASGLEVGQQQALLDNTLTQIDVLAKTRSQFEHAIATLTGTPAPSFSLPPQKQADMTPPAIPIGVPSDVLERRPDVASAERAMAAANAQIGVAKAAFYPSITMGPGLGWDSRVFPTLFDTPSLIWSLGVAATQNLFDGGRLRANLRFSEAGYQASVASYKRVVLTAMQEVEDGITGLSALDRATAQAQLAVNDSNKVLDMATTRYEGGATAYLDVITAQQAVLNTERQAAQLTGQRLLTSVFLVKALGGDWQKPEDLKQVAEAQAAAQAGRTAGPTPSSSTADTAPASAGSR